MSICIVKEVNRSKKINCERTLMKGLPESFLKKVIARKRETIKIPMKHWPRIRIGMR
jgi:hypothetical protein